MKVIVERNNVCMGDDCRAPHTKEYILSDDATYVDLFDGEKTYVSEDKCIFVPYDNNRGKQIHANRRSVRTIQGLLHENKRRKVHMVILEVYFYENR